MLNNDGSNWMELVVVLEMVFTVMICDDISFFVALEMVTHDVNNKNDVGCKVFSTTCKEH